MYCLKKTVRGLVLAGLWALGTAPVLRAEQVSIQWLGQSCFLIKTPDGIRVLMDPMSTLTGYQPVPPTVDVVTISHEHADHANFGLARGAFSVLRGVGPSGKDWNRVELEIGDTRIFNVASFHDDEKGAKRGLNSIFVIELPNFKLVHLGDLGHPLEKTQIMPLRGADVLLVPVGGVFTLDAAGAGHVVEQLQPKSVVIPMHYKTADLKNQSLSTVDAFLQGKNVVRPAGPEYLFDFAAVPKSRTYVVLSYK